MRRFNPWLRNGSLPIDRRLLTIQEENDRTSTASQVVEIYEATYPQSVMLARAGFSAQLRATSYIEPPDDHPTDLWCFVFTGNQHWLTEFDPSGEGLYDVPMDQGVLWWTKLTLPRAQKIEGLNTESPSCVACLDEIEGNGVDDAHRIKPGQKVYAMFAWSRGTYAITWSLSADLFIYR